ncbi:MAG: type IX secretion system membrane protein PorP/SprF [Bacteroidales bacterium]|nr:type IX secretion system membrane protein PorP/SprF [Bacteroidales bacterium]
MFWYAGSTRTWFGWESTSGHRCSFSISRLHLREKLYIGYSYDFPISDIGPYVGGSHEVMIAFKFNNLK